jgi:ATP-binding cassette, subfamily B, bacterial MsbA
MFSTLFTTYGVLGRLYPRLNVSRPRLVLTALLLIASGALEGATIGLLVPLLGMLTGAMGGASNLFPIIGPLFERVEPAQRIPLLGVGILGLVALKNVLGFLGTRSSGILRARALIEVRRQLLAQLLRASPATLERHTSGEITGVVITECSRVNRVLEAIIVLFQRAVIALSYVIAILMLSWQLTLATIGLGLFLGFAMHWLVRRVLVIGRGLTEASSQLGRQVTEVVGGLRVIRTTASEEVHQAAFAEHNRAHAEADIGTSVALTLQQGLTETLGVAGAMGLTAIAYTLWLVPNAGDAAALDVPRFLAFGFGLVRLLPVLNYMSATQGLITSTVGSLEAVVRWLDLPPYPTRRFGERAVPRLTDGIAFDALSFSYPNGHKVLSSLSFRLPVGETLGILGASGSGKSTIASLLLRLREPTAGAVRFDGVDHWEFSPAAFHAAVGFVDQEAFLFNSSILDNVTCGRTDITRADVVKALRLVQLGELIDRLPEGVDSVLAERGATLSGGQRQRLAIARAIVRNPQVLVLDEPTSALDPETEQEVVRAIDAVSRGRTTLIITHRATTLMHANRLLDLNTGKLSQPGGRELPAERAAV